MHFIDFIKTFFYNSHLDFLEVGDVILARRYDSLEEREKIPEGHQCGPYIVIRKFFNRVYALEASSHRSAKMLKLHKVLIKKSDNNSLNKDSLIYVGELKLLNKNRFIRKLGTISKEDLNKVYKSIYLVNKKYHEVKNFPLNKIKITYDIGDIISYGNILYYILKKDEEYYYAIIVRKTYKGSIVVKINDDYYSLNYYPIYKIPIDSKIYLEDITDANMIDRVNEFINTNKNKPNIHTKLSYGKIIKYNNNLYYVYGRYKSNILVYKLYTKKNKKNMYLLPLKAKRYYTKFEEDTILDNKGFRIVDSVSDLESIKIKDLRKEIKKRRN